MVAQITQAAGPETKNVEFLTQPNEVSFSQLRQVLTGIFPLSNVNVGTLSREEGLFRFETSLTNGGVYVGYTVFKYPYHPVQGGLLPPGDDNHFLLCTHFNFGDQYATFYPNYGIKLVDSRGQIISFVFPEEEPSEPVRHYFGEVTNLIYDLEQLI